MADAKVMWEAIKSRFGGNDESYKMKKYLLKQKFKGFSVSTLEGLHKRYDRFQTFLSHLEIHGAGVSHKDTNQKFLRSLPSSWSQVALIMRTKPGLDTLSFDDIYNNLRVFEHDVKGTTASSSNTQNVAFVSTNNTSRTNDVCTAYSVSSPTINDDDLDLIWQVAMISMRIKKFHKRIETVELKGTKTVEEEMLGTIKTKLETMVEDLHIRMTQKLWLPLMEMILTGESVHTLDSQITFDAFSTRSGIDVDVSILELDSQEAYLLDGSAEVHEKYDNNEIFNMFTQEEEYTELLEPIPEPQQVPQNDNNIIFEVTDVEQGREIVEQHSANFEETHALYESLYQNLAVEVEKVNSVNRKLKETNADLTTELARYKNQERCFEISQEKYDKLKDLNKQLSKEKSTVSFLLEEKKRLKSDFKTSEDELLDKQIQLEKKIKELNNILFKTGQSIQTIHMLSPKPDSFYHTEQKMALGYQNPFYLKQVQKKQQSLYDGKVLHEKHDPPVVQDSEETLQLAQE
nr:hypothetical protein [Tanacetum cinerariifolium]